MSLRKAINDKCRWCIYDPKSGGGTWREQVANCSAITCPLWPVRPAPGSGPLANPPRRAEDATREWVTLPVGGASLPHPTEGEGAGQALVWVESKTAETGHPNEM